MLLFFAELCGQKKTRSKAVMAVIAQTIAAVATVAVAAAAARSGRPVSYPRDHFQTMSSCPLIGRNCSL